MGARLESVCSLWVLQSWKVAWPGIGTHLMWRSVRILSQLSDSHAFSFGNIHFGDWWSEDWSFTLSYILSLRLYHHSRLGKNLSVWRTGISWYIIRLTNHGHNFIPEFYFLFSEWENYIFLRDEIQENKEGMLALTKDQTTACVSPWLYPFFAVVPDKRVLCPLTSRTFPVTVTQLGEW